MIKDREYEYSGTITYFCEHMVITHQAWVTLDDLYELQDAEEFLLIQADNFINDYYGFVPSKFATVDIEISWSYYPKDIGGE